MLPTWRAKGLWGPRSSIPALRQLRLLKVWQFCGETDKRVSEVTPLPGTRGLRAPRARPSAGAAWQETTTRTLDSPLSRQGKGPWATHEQTPSADHDHVNKEMQKPLIHPQGGKEHGLVTASSGLSGGLRALRHPPAGRPGARVVGCRIPSGSRTSRALCHENN